jgi:putative redox protein
MPSETRLHLVDGLHFTARTPAGRELHLDSIVSEDGAGATPMELQLVALGGCTAMDTISILRKMRLDVTEYDVTLTSERAEEHPRVYAAIRLTHLLRGRDVPESQVRRAIELTMTRYCPVFAMLSPGVAITEAYEITDEASGLVTAGEFMLDSIGGPGPPA